MKINRRKFLKSLFLLPFMKVNDIIEAPNHSIKSDDWHYTYGIFSSDCDRIVSFDGVIIDNAMWNCQLSNDEIRLLVNGISPLCVRSQNLVLYIPHVALAETSENAFFLSSYLTEDDVL